MAASDCQVKLSVLAAVVSGVFGTAMIKLATTSASLLTTLSRTLSLFFHVPPLKAIRLSVTQDGQTWQWQDVAYTVETKAQDGWTELQLLATPQALVQQLRLTVLAGSIPVTDLQLGHLELQGLN